MAEHASEETLVRITSGWAYEMRALDTDRRQLFSFLLPGDQALAPAHPTPEGVALVALTRLEVLEATPPPSVDGQCDRAELVAEVMAQEVARLRDQALRLGLLDAQSRIAHLVLDLHRRLSTLGLVNRDSYRAPLTQEMLASALGLSVVHVNRSLQRLRRRNLLTISAGRVLLHDVAALSAMAGGGSTTVPPPE